MIIQIGYVDIEAGEDLIKKIKNDVASTHGEHVIGNIGGFAECSMPKEFQNPILVACTDGVVQKLHSHRNLVIFMVLVKIW